MMNKPETVVRNPADSYGKRTTLRAELKRKETELRQLKEEVNRLRMDIRIAECVDMLWDGLPIHRVESSEHYAHLALVGKCNRGIIDLVREIRIYSNVQTRKPGEPLEFYFRISEKKERGGERWPAGKNYILGLKSMREAMKIAREWLTKGTIEGKVPQD